MWRVRRQQRAVVLLPQPVALVLSPALCLTLASTVAPPFRSLAGVKFVFSSKQTRGRGGTWWGSS